MIMRIIHDYDDHDVHFDDYVWIWCVYIYIYNIGITSYNTAISQRSDDSEWLSILFMAAILIMIAST